MEFDLYNFYRDIKSKRIIFCYSGPVAQVGLEGIAQTLRRNLVLEETSNNATHAVFSIFIEQMQNVLNYSAERPCQDPDPEKDLRVGMVIVGRDPDGFFIYCGNRVHNDDIKRLKNRIEEIRHLDKEELKALYKMRRRQTSEPGSKGGGLGLIEMARKAGKPIDYCFQSVDADSSFFSLKVLVCPEERK